MKKYRVFLVVLFILILLSFAMSVRAQSELELFMLEFEPDYGTEGDYVLNTRSPYVKPIRQMQTTESGVVLLLDKVLVTEDEIVVTVLMGIEPENEDWIPPSSFQLGFAAMEVTPHLPYPADYFEIIHGGGGGGGPILNEVHNDPFVVYDFIRSKLLFDDGYVSPKDSMHVIAKILFYEVCWDVVDAKDNDYVEQPCFREQGPWEFEFDTDGAELAKKTKEFELGEAFEIDGKTFSLDRFRFNPMHLIAFTSGPAVDYRYQDRIDSLTVFVETDDGTKVNLWPHMNPYIGFDRKVTNEAVIESLEETETLKVMFCLNALKGAPPKGYNPEDIKFYDCDPEMNVMIPVK